jgi:hypothetical protein
MFRRNLLLPSSGYFWRQQVPPKIYVTLLSTQPLARTRHVAQQSQSTRRDKITQNKTTHTYRSSISLSVYGSTDLCWALAAFSVSWSFTQSVGLFGRGIRTTQTQNKRTQTCMPQVGFEPTTPAFERAKTVHVLDPRGQCHRPTITYTTTKQSHISVAGFARKRTAQSNMAPYTK